MSRILVLNGPNLNLLGRREPEHSGDLTLDAINQRLEELAGQAGESLSCRQSNSESEIVEWIQQAPAGGVEFIIINPAAFTHTSVAIRDALVAVDMPTAATPVGMKSTPTCSRLAFDLNIPNI